MKLQDLRKHVGMTQQDLAREVECSIQEIQKIEQDPTKLTNCSYRICHALWYCLTIVPDDVERIELSDFVHEIVYTALQEKYVK